MKKFNPIALANGLAGAFALVHISFDILSFFAPSYLKYIFNSWFHGFNIGLVALQGNVSYDYPKIIFGFVTSVAAAWVFGYLIAVFYNRFLGEG